MFNVSTCLNQDEPPLDMNVDYINAFQTRQGLDVAKNFVENVIDEETVGLLITLGEPEQAK